jgi:hypothetical protein
MKSIFPCFVIGKPVILLTIFLHTILIDLGGRVDMQKRDWDFFTFPRV